LKLGFAAGQSLTGVDRANPQLTSTSMFTVIVKEVNQILIKM